jgi:hypothetical protein
MRVSKAKLIAGLAVLALLGVGAATAPAAFASSNETVFFEAPRDLFGVSLATQDATFAKLQSMGVHALRVVLYWGEVAPSPKHKTRPHFNQASPSAYHWGAYDQLVDAAVARHWQVLLTVTGGFGTVPRWATPHGEDQYSYPNPQDFGQFMEAVGKHFGKKVKLYSIWNEPNQPQYLRPQYVHGKLESATIYRNLFLAGYGGLKKSGNFSGMKVLMGETSPVGVQAAGIPAPLAFLRGVLCLNSSYEPVGHCAKVPAYGYAQHPYTVGGPGPFWHPSADDVSIGTIGRLVTALDKAAAAGAIRSDMPIYITEMGVQSVPKFYGVSLAQQAEYDAISEKIAFENPRVVAFDQYLLRDDPPTSSHNPVLRWPGFETGLETYNGKQKPAYDEFRLPLVVTRTHSGVSFWGLVRPAGDPIAAPTTGATGATGATGKPGATTAVLEYSSNGGHSWRTLMHVHTASNGSWSASGNFASHRLWRVRWVAAGGTSYVGAPTRAYTTAGKVDY